MEKQKAEVGKMYRTPVLPTLRSIDEEARTIEFVASTEAQDRYGDVIRVAGWKFGNYLKNPVFLWGHKSGEPPIGRTVELRTEANPPALIQRVEFADASTYPFADTVFNLYKNGFMRAVSVGFIPLEQPNPIKNLDGFTTGWEFTSQELLELSAVPIPANPEAVARAVRGGLSRPEMEKAFSDEGEYVFWSASQLRDYSAALADLSLLLRDVRILNLRQGVSNMAALLLLALSKTRRAPKRPESTRKDGAITTLDELSDALKGGHLIMRTYP